MIVFHLFPWKVIGLLLHSNLPQLPRPWTAEVATFPMCLHCVFRVNVADLNFELHGMDIGLLTLPEKIHNFHKKAPIFIIKLTF
jgi:hypothetical protein